ncbi:heterokaryon incompatibility protein-domain-containing protein [Sordaria brevicollis]|uniref:Heterokaryon incompatibility protein-domain-containing protein n=1 Tax=Sordaria brevicollis TaxID=83679 RepID=A0AAE0PBR5_SORBR|nr:heterokaryon incompatibility protein-domain-containing protein [Sordaria brevicollis]
MRLLKTDTFELLEFVGEGIPKYAILSHTWEGKEVSFQDIQHPDALKYLRASNPPTPAWSKVKHSCRKAQEEGYEYIWIDTCCIDKSSSAELQEAINSMFAWYRKAAICYAFLSDIESRNGISATEVLNITKSRWFTRGWTLQELLAPDSLQFYNASWEPLGSRSEWASLISQATTIPVGCLADSEHGKTRESIEELLQQCTVAARMSWAATRQTTRIEDQAYCLLGLFDINLPMLYGEGKKAFMRLQQEIMKTSDDATILAWGYGTPVDREAYMAGAYEHETHDPKVYRRRLREQACKIRPRSLLASSPADFRYAGSLQKYDGSQPLSLDFAITQRGLMLDGLWGFDSRYHLQYLFIPCTDIHGNVLALPMLSLLNIYRYQSYRDRIVANMLCVPLATAPAGQLSTQYKESLSLKQAKYYLSANHSNPSIPPKLDQFYHPRTLALSFRTRPPWPNHDAPEFSVETAHPPLSKQPFRFVLPRGGMADKVRLINGESDNQEGFYETVISYPPSQSLTFILKIGGKRILLVIGGQSPRSIVCHAQILGAYELLRPTLTEINSFKTISSWRVRWYNGPALLPPFEPYLKIELFPGLELSARWCTPGVESG